MRYRTCRSVLYVATIFTPFTSLRFGLLGIGELLFFLALFMVLLQSGAWLRSDPPVKPVTGFWLGYLALITIGFLFNVIVLDHSSGTYSGAAFDFLSYVLILLVVLIVGHPPLYAGTTAYLFFETVFTLWGLVFSVLYLVSLQTTHIFGFPLRYYSYFSPLVENLHQAATITAPMPFIMWHLALGRDSFRMRVLYVIAGILFVRMALESGSTKAALGLILGAGASTLFFFFQQLPLGRSRAIRILVTTALGCVAIGALAFQADTIVPLIANFFYENDGNAARENLYTIGFLHGLSSPVVGFGPGPHVELSAGTFWDAHNTLLTVFLQGGLCAVVLLMITTVRVCVAGSRPFLLLGALTAIGVYVLGGDVLRRLPTWLMVVGIIYLSSPRAVLGIKKAGKPASTGPSSTPLCLPSQHRKSHAVGSE